MVDFGGKLSDNFSQKNYSVTFLQVWLFPGTPGIDIFVKKGFYTKSK